MSKGLFDFARFEVIKSCIGSLEREEYYHFFDNKWYLHELILYIVSFTGKVDIRLTNFSLSENAIRVFMNLKDAGFINSITCLFDKQVIRHKKGLYSFADNVVDKIGITECHAKLCLFENDSWNVVLNGSANLTINPRYEAGMICTKKSVYEIYKDRFNEIFNESILINDY